MSAILSNVQGFLTKNSEMLKILLIIVAVGAVVYYMKCNYFRENLYMQDYQKYDPQSRDGKLPLKDEEAVTGARTKDDLSYGVYDVKTVAQDVKPEDLLPKTDLQGVFKDDTDILMGNFVTPGVTYGIDTVGSALKKTNYAIRSMPQIPVNRDISPWNLSSYEPDIYRKPIE